MQECDFENLYFVFYVEKIVAGQVSLILSSKGLNHNLKILPPASEIFLLHSTTWFLYLKKKPDSRSQCHTETADYHYYYQVPRSFQAS